MLYTSADLLQQAIRGVVFEGKHYVDGAFAEWAARSLFGLSHAHEAIEVHRVETRFEDSVVACRLHELLK
jgi:hypothetical protein